MKRLITSVWVSTKPLLFYSSGLSSPVQSFQSKITIYTFLLVVYNVYVVTECPDNCVSCNHNDEFSKMECGTCKSGYVVEGDICKGE